MSVPPPPPPRRPIDPLLQRPPTGSVPPPPQPHHLPAGAAAPARPHSTAAPAGANRSASSSGRRRVRPARRSKVASLVVSVTATVGLTAAFARSSSTVAVDMAGGVDSGDGGALAPTAGNTAANAAPSSAASAGASDTAVPPVEIDIADGTYTGDTFTNRWGPVQVQIVYAAGDITDVVVLRYPDGDRRSVAINQRALPRLESNVIASQSADIARVTGATYTWRSYRLSLQSAIDAAVSASQGGG